MRAILYDRDGEQLGISDIDLYYDHIRGPELIGRAACRLPYVRGLFTVKDMWRAKHPTGQPDFISGDTEASIICRFARQAKADGKIKVLIIPSGGFTYDELERLES